MNTPVQNSNSVEKYQPISEVFQCSQQEVRDEVASTAQDVNSAKKFQAISQVFPWGSEKFAELVSEDATTDDTPPRKFQPASMLFQFDARGEITSSAPVLLESFDPPQKLLPPYVSILNHEVFPKNPETNRQGSSKDVEALRKTFGMLECEIEEVPNPTLATVKDTIRKLALKSFLTLSALVIVILSHGDQKDKIHTCDDKAYNLDDDILFPLFQNESLANKPKILIIQACKGAWQADSSIIKANPSSYIKCYSTTEGFKSYRHPKNGSLFIQTLCNLMDQHGLTKDFRSIIEDVNANVERQAIFHGCKQVPSITSTLRQPFCFGDFVQHTTKVKS
ncbi:caspase-3 isoform X1 [Drosophila elegans]|uniref:caspase-3 isoform X1 n=1 Tax=Drosophila elegans TaxID=30023 RepID=UPI001BC8359B|nr:caspase-3 isoform X1 [Drosophila elegans]